MAKRENKDIDSKLNDDDLDEIERATAVPDYSKVFLSDTVDPTPQPGILPPQLSNMAFVVITLKKDCHHDTVKNALVAIENIQKPPYIDANQTRFPQQVNDKDYDGTDTNVSFYTFARRTSNLLPTNELHFSIGFSYNLWVDKWKMDAPKGFLNFTDWNNPYDKSSKPFKDEKDNDLYKPYYNDKEFSIPAEKKQKESDILIQIKSSSRSLIDRAAAHVLKLLHNQSDKIEVRYGHCKQRNQFGFFDAASQAQFTANPTVDCGAVVRAWNTNCNDAKKKRDKYGDQYIDIGRISTILIGNEANNNNQKNGDKNINGTFSVLAQFVHDLKSFNKLPIPKQRLIQHS